MAKIKYSLQPAYAHLVHFSSTVYSWKCSILRQLAGTCLLRGSKKLIFKQHFYLNHSLITEQQHPKSSCFTKLLIERAEWSALFHVNFAESAWIYYTLSFKMTLPKRTWLVDQRFDYVTATCLNSFFFFGWYFWLTTGVVFSDHDLICPSVSLILSWEFRMCFEIRLRLCILNFGIICKTKFNWGELVFCFEELSRNCFQTDTF